MSECGGGFRHRPDGRRRQGGTGPRGASGSGRLISASGAAILAALLALSCGREGKPEMQNRGAPPAATRTGGDQDTRPVIRIHPDTAGPAGSPQDARRPPDYFDSLAWGYFGKEAEESPATGSEPAGIRLLVTGEYHESEVPEDAEAAEWKGLFWDKESGYRLARTAVSISRFHDPFGDEDAFGNEDTSIKTGKRVVATAAAECRLLIQGLDTLPEGPVPTASPETGELRPGARIRFGFQGTTYELAATADSGWSPGESTLIVDYRLYLSATGAGVRATQLVVALPWNDDKTMSLLWAGDLDGDGRLDLILDDSNHYNLWSSSLYLSGHAGPGRLLRRVARHEQGGC